MLRSFTLCPVGRAYVLEGKSVKLDTVSFPDSSLPFQLAVRVEIVGICRSDLKELAGDRHGPSIFGHEWVGTVLFTFGSSNFAFGDRVTLNPNEEIARTSGFADVVFFSSESEAELISAVIKLERSDDPMTLVFSEPLACATKCVRSMLSQADGSYLQVRDIAVIGAGIFGILISMHLHDQGRTVTLINRSKERREFVDSLALGLPILGFSECLPNQFDAVCVATTNITGGALDEAVRIVKDKGLIHLFGGTKPGELVGSTPLDADLVRRHGQGIQYSSGAKSVMVSGSRGAEATDFVDSIRSLRTTEWKEVCRKLTTQVVSFDNFPEFLISLSKSPNHGRAVLFPNGVAVDFVEMSSRLSLLTGLNLQFSRTHESRSAASVHFVIYQGERCVLKISDNLTSESGTQKLRQEALFLQKNSAGLRFPKVLACGDFPGGYWFLIPEYVGFRNLESIHRTLSNGELTRIVTSVIKYCFENLYRFDKGEISQNYLQLRMLGRVERRLMETGDLAVLYSNEALVINGKPVASVRRMLRELCEVPHLFQPQFRCNTHDDLCADNILVSPQGDFVLIDPRGDDLDPALRDYCYDVAKLLFSFSGYIGIVRGTTRAFETMPGQYTVSGIEHNDSICELILQTVSSLRNKYFPEDVNFLPRIRLAEACHYFSCFPAGGDADSQRLIRTSMYLLGAMKLHEVYFDVTVSTNQRISE